MVNTGLAIEVLIASVVVISGFVLFFFHYASLTTLLLNEKESRRILSLLVLSDELVDSKLAVTRMGVKMYNEVDCQKLLSMECNGYYVECGPYRCGDVEEGITVKRYAVWRGEPVTVVVRR